MILSQWPMLLQLCVVVSHQRRIPGGMIRNFKADLHAFKPMCRDKISREALNAMAPGGGCI